jgi:hypothetical protein
MLSQIPRKLVFCQRDSVAAGNGLAGTIFSASASKPGSPCNGLSSASDPDELMQLFQHLAVCVNQQLGITNNVDKQAITDLKAQTGWLFVRHKV